MTPVERAEKAAMMAMRRLGRARARHNAAVYPKPEHNTALYNAMEAVKSAADRLDAADRKAAAERRAVNRARVTAARVGGE